MEWLRKLMRGRIGRTDAPPTSTPPQEPATSGTSERVPSVRFTIAGQHFDLVELLQTVLQENGHAGQAQDDCVVLSSGYAFHPELDECRRDDKANWRTSTRIRIAHPQLVDPHHVSEHQHAGDKDLDAAFRSGFANWAAVDLPPLLDAIEFKPKNSLSLELTGADGCHRRALLGPVAHYAQRPQTEPSEHDFCACCMFTQSLEALRVMVDIDTFIGIRLFAARDSEGVVMADCRVNGRDFPPGRDALMRYAATWPQRGYEHRKQYAVVHTLASAPKEGT